MRRTAALALVAACSTLVSGLPGEQPSGQTVVNPAGEVLYAVTTEAEPPEAGTTSGDGSYAPIVGYISVNATPKLGYVFVNWTKDGTEVWRTPQHTFEPRADIHLVAHFEPVRIEAPVSLGSAAAFAVLGASWGLNPDPHLIIWDKVGVSPGTIPANATLPVLLQEPHSGDAIAAQAQLDQTAAYNDCASRLNPKPWPMGAYDTWISPGVYRTAGAPSTYLYQSYTFDAGGNPDAVFIIQVPSSLWASSAMYLAGGAQASAIFWQVEGEASIDARNVKGTFLARGAVGLWPNSTLDGRAFSQTSSVSLRGERITVPIEVQSNWMIF